MRATEFLKEDTSELARVLKASSMSDDQRTQLIGTVEQIKLHCQPFLNEVEDPFSLLRGLRPMHAWAINKPVRLDDRHPMSTPQKLHDQINQIFVDKFKEPFRNAMFCTGDHNTAIKYGMPFAIYPVGNYTYLWSPYYRDLYTEYDYYRSANSKEDFIPSVNWDSYRTTHLNEAMATGNEIMIRTKSYYGLNMNHIEFDRNKGPMLNAIQEYFMS